MPRPRSRRRICSSPNATFYKPQGVPLSQLEVVELTIEEWEALRLKDVENIDQNAAAENMNTSQSTFQRILSSARKKMAVAITSGKAIRIK